MSAAPGRLRRGAAAVRRAWSSSFAALAKHRTTLEDAAKLITISSALVAAALYMWETSDRRLERLYRAWDVVGRAGADSVNGARNAALEDLAKHDFPLGGIRLSKVALRNVDLRAAKLRGASFPNADLDSARLDRANLADADLQAATLRFSSLASANLSSALLGATEFRRASLAGANLEGADLQHAILVAADLSDAMAYRADLREAKLFGANLQGVNFKSADLRGASLDAVRNWKLIRCLRRANIAHVADAPDGFVEWAIKEMGAVAEPRDSIWEDLRNAPDTQPAAGLTGAFTRRRTPSC